LLVRYVRSVGGDPALERVLERAGETRPIAELSDESRWSTHAQRVALLDAASEVLDDPDFGRHLGENAISHGVGATVKLMIRALGSPERVLRNLGKTVPKFSTVSDLRASSIERSTADVEYRVREPHVPNRQDCGYTQGLLTQIPVLFGLPPARVVHEACQADGAEWCVYRMKWRSRRRRFGRNRTRINDLEEQINTLRDSTDALRAMTIDLVSPDDLDEVLGRIVDGAFGTLGAEGIVFVVDAEPIGRRVFHDGISLEAAEAAMSLLERHGEAALDYPVLLTDVTSSRRSYGRVAVLSPGGGEFFEGDRNLLEAYARHAAVALDVASALEEARRQNETASMLLGLARSLADPISVAEVSHKIARGASALVGAQRAMVLLWDGTKEEMSVAATHGIPRGSIAEGLKDTICDRGFLNELLGSEKVEVRVGDSGDDFVARLMRAMGAGAAAVVPMRRYGRSLGAICATWEDGDAMPPAHRSDGRLSGLAEQAVRALENAELLERQTERSERLAGQKEILEMLARGADLRQILDALCLTVQEQIEGAGCAVLLMDRERETLQTVSAPTLPGEFVWAINGTVPGPFALSSGTAVFREHAVYVADVATDPLWEGRRGAALERGILAGWALPIFDVGTARVLGAFAAYVDHEGLPGEADRAFMEMAVQLAAIAIERKELEEQLTHQAFHDSLTGLPNRALFSDRVQHALDRSTRQDGSIAVLLIDLDNFKAINDSMGHLAGDELLRSVADRLRSCLRAADTAARLGGDEFAVLLEGTDERTVMHVAQRIRESLSEPIVLQGREVLASGSVGVAFTDDGSGTMSDLLRNADTAMYVAKDAGRDRVEVFEQRMHSGIMKRLELQAELQRAVDRDEIVVHYQPVYRLDPNALVGVEALVRWAHPTKGLIPPLDFIPMAEETGLIVPIGLRVLEKTCAQLRAWQDDLGRKHPIRAGVNFSARQLQEPALVDEIVGALERHGLDPKALVVEITESVLMHDPDDIADKLERLSDLGVGIAIDDFGTGYSSLSYLRRFPVNVLKVDKFFVQGIDRGPEEASYAQAIVRLGHSLDLDVCAEGIETAQEFEALLEMGCTYGQGYLFSPPVPAEAIAALPGARGADFLLSPEPL
jgi:diguanylate cyclase (GGDEF)-like protein